MSELKKRLITGVVGLIILGLILYFGGNYLRIALILISMLGSYEMYNAYKKINININFLVILIGIFSIFVFELVGFSLEFSVVITLLLSFIFTLFSERYNLNDVAYTILTFIYVPYLFSLMLEFENTPYLYLIFIIAFSTDTFAYFVGSKFGKHKLIEKISPKKSIEGSIGGILGCLILSLVYFYITGISINIVSFIFVIIGSISGQIGDLIASKIKRVVGIKDYGKLLPGHGGIMDRFDSIITVIPIVYMLYFITVLY
ncbi:phosphatidate cytidylyltransferase [Peptoniphilus mikwangii]|uniref:phosphatidate cytidylyltransferase n=1 Tax=Peptoniphilus mikwangii TaxID=1354300 RepID=UPI0003F56CD8|nr:phosphatidate cytidylyltransferase [Peptoniphilus mikwangii]